MKTKILLLILAIMTTSVATARQTGTDSKKILIVYFSHSGNTQIVAEYIRKATGGDIFRIEPAMPYPSDYNAVVKQAKKEVESGYQPAIRGGVDNIGSYDVIFVGSPSWWATIAPPVATFLASNDLSGKIIVPFITHEGSRMGHSVDDIKKLCPSATVIEGLPIRGGSVAGESEEVEKWLRKINITK